MVASHTHCSPKREEKHTTCRRLVPVPYCTFTLASLYEKFIKKKVLLIFYFF